MNQNQEVKPEPDTTIAKTCYHCCKTVMIHVVFADAIKWQEGALIQDVMGYLSVDEREILISGTCGECFDKMFA